MVFLQTVSLMHGEQQLLNVGVRAGISKKKCLEIIEQIREKTKKLKM